MELGRYLVEAHLREGRSVTELAAAHGIHPSWIYKLLGRYREHGEAGLAARSRRPRSSPTQVATELEDEIVLLRKQLFEEGLDAGAVTIHWHLSRRHPEVPSVSSIWRVLKRRGFVVPQPKKRPRSSFVRFEAELPNETWQSDMTHWSLAHGTGVEIVNFIDDHSRLCLASVARAVARATDVAEIFIAAAQRYGTPASVLTDNGCIYTAKHRGGKVVMETLLETLGVTYKHSSPYHPQTCGKVERFHQTEKRFLAKQPGAADLAELQAQLDRFVAYYNASRPHRALGRRTPGEVFEAKVKARPRHHVPNTHFRVRHDKVDKTGCVTLRYESRLLHIGIGRAHTGERVLMLIADRDVRVVSENGELIRQLTIDPTRDYQRRR
ncbi:MAG TPA: IS481 family transposase [Acidimicrobiales bacterium]|nr:IS481 family transposase [Acidimicrobiales bacterium]